MNTLKKFYREILLPACLIFTLLCFSFAIILHAAKMEMAVPTIGLGNMTQIFAFSLLFTASWQFFKMKRMAFPVALLLHFIAFLGSVAIVFFVIGGHYTSLHNALVILFVFALIYVIAAAIGITVRHFVISGKEEKTPYKRQFR
ncbi:MAG: hypothetical protein IJD10_06695 [Clostridia bacterium]|nr:hypothetical protein [Clostridia bacterium]